MASGWRVTGQRQSAQLTQDARFMDVMEVSVATDEGSTFTLYIPTSKYSAESVRAEIEDRVRHIHAIEQF